MSSPAPGDAQVLSFTASDGYQWCYRFYSPSEPPRAHVVCLHGIQSHGGWYERSCRHLAGAGFAVSFLDRRGSGLNAQARGDAPSFRRLLDDVAEFLRSPHNPGPKGKPVVLLAISWGGKPAAALLRRHPGLVDALALVCPGFCPLVRPPLAQRLAILGARLLSPRRLFPVPLDDPALFTANPDGQYFIQNDPLGLRQATARFLVESVRLDLYLRWVPGHVRVPVLLLLAEKDRIVDNARTRAFVRRFASPDRRVIEYAGAHHTLEFEPDPEPFLRDLAGWVAQLVA